MRFYTQAEHYHERGQNDASDGCGTFVARFYTMNALDSHTPARQLHIRLRSYRAAMERAAGGWQGPSLKRRRRELRRLADECGKRDQLEVVLRCLREQRAEGATARARALTG